MTITFKFELGQKILIREISEAGTIRAAKVDSFGIQYFVTYWLNGKQEDGYLFEDELSESRQ